MDRIAQPGDKLEILVDPLDLGAISVLANGDLIPVPCLDDTMRGKSLSWWHAEKARRKAEAELDVSSHAEVREEARSAWRGKATATAASAGVNMKGRTAKKIARLAHELSFGKGGHERPFIGRDEHVDPVHAGFGTGVGKGNAKARFASPQPEETTGDTGPSGPLDRSRSNGTRRRPKP